MQINGHGCVPKQNLIHGTENGNFIQLLCGDIIAFFWLLKTFFWCESIFKFFIEFKWQLLLLFLMFILKNMRSWSETELANSIKAEALSFQLQGVSSFGF